MTESTSLGVGLYSLVEAARLLRTPRSTLSRWVDGYIREVRDGQREYPPVISRPDDVALTFGDLIELRYTREFRKAGVELGSIRMVGMKYRKEWNTLYPLTTRRFINDGRDLLLKEGEDWKHALTGQLLGFLSDVEKELVHDGDSVIEWRPLGRDRQVVLHPDRSFGKPIDNRSGAHTYVLAQAMRAGQDLSEVAWWYGTTGDSVLDAVEFEDKWQEKPDAAA